MKVMCAFGTRPEAIKMVPVINELRRRSKKSSISVSVVVTAQHRHMLDQVLDVFGIRPDYDLNVMTENQSPAHVAATVLTRLEPVLDNEKPDWMLVQGDTTTAFAASQAAFYKGIKVGHIEAGLRTHNRAWPFPEEINRRLVSVLADVHFAPTKGARDNLLREGISEEAITVTGNTVIDALVLARNLPLTKSIKTLANDLRRRCKEVPRLILLTMHRRENFGEPVAEVCRAVNEITKKYNGGVHVVYPVHPNPAVKGPVHKYLSGNPFVSLVNPLDYLSLVQLMKLSTVILTDSGGIQEEAPFLGKPVLVLREVTERPEALDAGVAAMVGTDRDRIVKSVVRLLDSPGAYKKMAHRVSPYGDGHAARRIVSALLRRSTESRVSRSQAP